MSDWGKGVSNNDIEWGRGSTNNGGNGWGDIYGDSWSGDTELELGFDPDALAFFTEIENQGGTLSATVKTAYDNFVKREKDASRYAKIKRLYPYLGGVIDSARIDAITLAQATNNNFVDGDVDSLIGVTPDGSTKFLNVNTAANVLFSSPFDAQAGVFLKGTITSTFQVYLSYQDTTTTNNILSIQSFSGANRFYFPGLSEFASASSTAADRDIVGGRFADNEITVWSDGATNTNTATTASLSIATLSPYIFARNTNGLATSFSSTPQFGAYIATSMTPTEVNLFRASYKTFLTDIGAI